MIEPIALVADAEKEFNEDLNFPISFKKNTTDKEAQGKKHDEDEFIYFQN